MPSFAILEAPSTLGLTGTGVERLPKVLLGHGLASRLGARHAGRVEPPVPEARRDPETTVLNAAQIAAWTPRLAAALEPLFGAGNFPVVLGGDCTILLGAMLALRRRGRYGLLFLDGHADFFQPAAEPNGEGASMELAWATGHGPQLLTHIGGAAPLVRSADVVAFGFRDNDDQAEYGSQPLPADLLVLDLPAVRQAGIAAAARAAVEHLTHPDLDGFFIHLDADVLDDATMPAVDFRIPGGLSPDELATVIHLALASGKVVGIEVTIYNPDLDTDGTAGRELADVLVSTLLPDDPTGR